MQIEYGEQFLKEQDAIVLGFYPADEWPDTGFGVALRQGAVGHLRGV